MLEYLFLTLFLKGTMKFLEGVLPFRKLPGYFKPQQVDRSGDCRAKQTWKPLLTFAC